MKTVTYEILNDYFGISGFSEFWDVERGLLTRWANRPGNVEIIGKSTFNCLCGHLRVWGTTQHKWHVDPRDVIVKGLRLDDHTC